METSLAIIVIAIILILLYIRSKTEKEISETQPNVIIENNTLVLIHGEYEIIKNIVTDFCKLYNDKSQKIQPRLIEYTNQSTFIVFPYSIGFENLCFLHNYLTYPKNRSHGFDLTTWYTAKTNTNWVHEKMQFKKIQLYISETETGYDNVYAITENNDCFKIDFAEGVSEIEQMGKSYIAPIIEIEVLRSMPFEDIL